MSFKLSGATWNDVAGRIWPAGLVFDSCALVNRQGCNYESGALKMMLHRVKLHRLNGGFKKFGSQKGTTGIYSVFMKHNQSQASQRWKGLRKTQGRCFHCLFISMFYSFISFTLCVWKGAFWELEVVRMKCICTGFWVTSGTKCLNSTSFPPDSGETPPGNNPGSAGINETDGREADWHETLFTARAPKKSSALNKSQGRKIHEKNPITLFFWKSGHRIEAKYQIPHFC